MSIQSIVSQTRPEMERSLDHFSKELSKIRTGQASPSLVEDVMVEVYGSKMPLKQLAGISCPERNQIFIQPWDRSNLESIERALQQGTMGGSPIVEQSGIRITLPPLTEEFREKLFRVVKEKAEECRENMRRSREEAWSEIQEKTREGEIREDDKYKGKEELQKLIDEYSKKIDELIQKKKKEIEI